MSRLIFNMAAKCDKAGRSENQDNYWVCPDLTHWDAPTGKTVGNDEDIELSDKGALLVVADGMGGMNAGEKASELVIAGVKKRFSNILDDILSDEEAIKKFIKDTITEADQSVKNYAKSNRSAEGLGSTIVLLWILNDRAYCGWCGDSRIYRYNPNNELIRLSHDHSYVQGLVDDGKISEEDAFDHPDGNIITRSLGDNGDVANPEIMVYDVCERDVFLLCSDGLCGLLQDKEIEEIVSTNCSSTKDALAALWEAGTKAGWSDNATIDLLYVISGGKHPKGVAVGYPIKKQTGSTKKTSESKKNSNKSVVSSESAAVKFLKSPYLYYILVVAIAVLGLALYQTCSSNSNGEQKKFNVTIGTGGYTISSQTDENNEQNGNSNTGDSNGYLGGHNPGNQNNGNTGVNQQNNNNGRNTNGNNSHNNVNGNNGRTNGNNSGNNGNNGANNSGNNASTIISSINGQQGISPSQEPTQIQPDPQYLQQLETVRRDIGNVREAWRTVCQKRNITKGEKDRLNNFVKNVTHLAEKTNPSYKCLDKSSQKEIDGWLKLANQIKANINNIPLLDNQQPTQGGGHGYYIFN